MRTVDLFAGAGGMSLGFINAGFDVVGAFDTWAPAVETYRANFDHPVFEADLSDPSALDQVAALAPEVIIGGPPCQDFSSAGKRDETLGRADLTVAFAELVASLQPAWFVMENVQLAQKSWALSRAKRMFKGAGYGLTERVIDASLCGVPQKRRRLFLIGQHSGAADALGALLDARLSESPMSLREYFGAHIGFDHYYRHPRSYARRGVFSADEPSPTIRGVNRPIPRGYPGHPGDTAPVKAGVRPLTTHERAQVQTFPPEFTFIGTKTDKEQLIGNAVPVKLAEFVGQAVADFASGAVAPPTQLRLING